MNEIERLMNWYVSQCDDDWEHTFGIRIETIDNPGWSLKVDITETNVEGRTMEEESIDDEYDWYSIKSDGETFKGYGDPAKLQFLLEQFAKFIS